MAQVQEDISSAAVLERLKDIILSVANPTRIIVFGSVARGTANANSDIDVLVVMAETPSRRQVAGDIYVKCIGFPYAVDVIVATEADLEQYRDCKYLIYYPALHEGREIYAA
jgi:predicted nucleotidyltransferase